MCLWGEEVAPDTLIVVPSYGRIQEALKTSCLEVAEKSQQGLMVRWLHTRVQRLLQFQFTGLSSPGDLSLVMSSVITGL